MASLAHQNRVVCVAFSPDGRIVLTGANDGTAVLWDASTGLPLGPPFRHYGRVVGTVFARDGEIVWTGGHDHTLRCWTTSTPLEGDAKRIALWVQVLTYMEMDAAGEVHELDAETWADRRRQLDEVGGAPAP